MSELYEELVNLETERDHLRQRVAELEAELEPCRVYMKKGESIVECLDRNRSDALRMTVKWNERGERMKEMRQQIPYRYWKQWFDKNGKGEPL